MNGKFVTGAIIGAVAGMMIMPELDRQTKKRITRSSRTVQHVAMDMLRNMNRKMR